jgi:hypothetical protein
MIAFRNSRQLERQYFRDLLKNQYKKVLLEKWDDEVIYNQRVLFGLVEEFHHLGYFDEELWTKIVDTAIGKKKINNTHYWATIYETLRKIDTDESCPLKGKFTSKIDELVKKHYTEDRKWRYNLENGGSWFSLEDM